LFSSFAILLSLVFKRRSFMFIIPFITLALAAFGVASPLIQSLPLEKRAAGDVITRCTVPGTAALTFDDGPFVYLYDISNALKKANSTGTFFLNGNNWGCIYSSDNVQRVKYAVSQGHQVASHSWSHSHLNSLNWDQLHDEFWRMEEALMKITGTYPAFMRPPFGEYNDLVREVARVRGQALALWDFDSGDSAGFSVAARKKRYTKLANSHPSTILALNHETSESTAHAVVPHAITVLKNAGYRLVTVAECLGQQPYQWTTAPGVPDASWHC